jgi:acetolactate decarboxylase
MVFFICSAISVHADEISNSSPLYQVSSFAMLEKGNLSAVITVDDMNTYGDFGVGGFEGLDGELSQIDGKIYQIKSDGTVVEPSGDMGVCFGNTIEFNPQYSFQQNESIKMDDLLEKINVSFPDQNIIYAYRIDGYFPEILVRSLPGQDEPYPTLAEVVENQSVFNLQNENGTISGFWFPQWMQGVNYAGFHPHFITESRNAGGHVMDGTAEKVTISVEPVYEFTMFLQDNKLNIENV